MNKEKLNKFLRKIEKCKARCQTSMGRELLESLAFNLVDKYLQRLIK